MGRKSATANGGLGLLERGGSSGSIISDGRNGEGEAGEEEMVNGEREEEDDMKDFLLPIKYLTDPGRRDTDELRAWASSAPEMKDVS